MDDILRSEVIIVLQQQQNGVHVEDFAGLFRKTFGYEFKLSNYGYKSLKSILNDMKDDVVLIESTHGLVIKCVSLSDESAQLSGSGVSQTDVPHVLKSQTSPTPDPVATQDNKTGNQTENEHSSTAQLGTNTSISNIPSSGQKPSNNQLHVFDQIQFQHANSPNEQSDKKITTNVAKASSSSSKKMSSTQHNCTTKTEKSQPVQKHSKTAMPQKSKHFATSRPRKHSTNSVSKIKTEKMVSNSSYIQQNKLTRTIAPSGTGTKQLPYKQTKAGIKTSLAKQNMQQQTLSNQLVLPVNVLYNRNMQGYQNVQTVSKVQENVLYADAIKKNLNLRQSAFQSTPIRNAQQNKENHNLQTFHPSPCIPRTEHMAPALSPTVKQNIQKVLMIHTNGISIFQLQKVYNFMFRQPLSLNRFSSMKQLLMKIKDVVNIQGLGVQTRLYPISSDVIPTPTVCDQYGFSLLIKETSMKNDNVLVNANLGKTDTAEECYSLSSMKTNTEPPKMVEVNVPTLSSRKETCKTSSVVNLETSTNLVQSLMSTTKDCSSFSAEGNNLTWTIPDVV
ncbi:uncharacterized protein LOC128638903 [Bombina bombina]|uniref:uncharacterized protein LOC128638903 n=1 Tax=Bombina bombina TaxID=8345 RepID=UPI00235A8C9C|nr:uncharacterized protein LOC128638903 [Bombina bombina]